MENDYCTVQCSTVHDGGGLSCPWLERMGPLLFVAVGLTPGLSVLSHSALEWRPEQPLDAWCERAVFSLPNCSVWEAFEHSLPDATSPAVKWAPWEAYVAALYGRKAVGRVNVSAFNVFNGLTIENGLFCPGVHVQRRKTRTTLVCPGIFIQRRKVATAAASSHALVEVTREAAESIFPEGRGYGCWFNVARGTGAWLDVGRTIRMRERDAISRFHTARELSTGRPLRHDELTRNSTWTKAGLCVLLAPTRRGDVVLIDRTAMAASGTPPEEALTGPGAYWERHRWCVQRAIDLGAIGQVERWGGPLEPPLARTAGELAQYVFYVPAVDGTVALNLRLEGLDSLQLGRQHLRATRDVLLLASDPCVLGQEPLRDACPPRGVVWSGLPHAAVGLPGFARTNVSGTTENRSTSAALPHRNVMSSLGLRECRCTSWGAYGSLLPSAAVVAEGLAAGHQSSGGPMRCDTTTAGTVNNDDANESDDYDGPWGVTGAAWRHP